ncbi:MAG: NAD(P)/FAD-dependent oxidoreductase [Salinivirgaceae bacterium]|nr:NAD(P)/FAD-dependent oxidoreductase [Salinivirgaceae bacterium]
MEYDIIIIGSGLGGLECGAILSKEGFNVCVLEKNSNFGGCFQTYQRGSHLLDTGIHYVGSLDDGQIMNQYFKYLGIMDKLRLRKLDAEAFDQIHYHGKVYNYAMGHERFVDTLARQFPAERDNLHRYVNQLKEVGDLISVENLRKGVIATEGMLYFCTSAARLIEETIGNPDLQEVLAGSALLYGGIRNLSTFYGHAMINNSYIESAYRFVDGTIQVSHELIKVIRANGGTVLNNAEVTRIVADDSGAKAVIVNGIERIDAKRIISNVHPQRTLELLDKSRAIKNAYITRINSLPNTYGIFSIYLIVKPKTLKYNNFNIYLHGNNSVWYDRQNYPGHTTNCMISMQAHTADSEWAEVVTILTPMYYEEVAEWADSKPEHRGERYKLFKEAKTRQVLDFIRQHGIDYEPYIESIYTTTPLSYRDYTATPEGSAYGIIKDYKCPQVGFVSTRTKLGNLYLTGQNLNVHGALGVTLTAIITCSEFLGQEYLAKKVGNA